jgi:LemA protein
MDPILWIIVGIVILGLGFLVATYNSLIALKTRAQNAQKDIDVQLKRRYELIPNLIETVKGVAKQEKELFTKVTEARAGLVKGSIQDKVDSNNQLTQTLKSLFAVAESYPDMKSNKSYENLQAELVDTQDKIMAAERFYNSNVQSFDQKVQSFPTNVIAGMFGFNEKDFDYLQVPEENKGNVSVDFSEGK